MPLPAPRRWFVSLAGVAAILTLGASTLAAQVKPATDLARSPFLSADKLNGALPLYHSTDDQNVGTAPINSERLFHALQGLGKDVSLYMYPYEDHGPIARETVLDQWARWVAWLDKYVKGAGDKKPVAMEDE